MRILITGGAGFIGSRLARRLQKDGHSVTVLDCLLPQVHGGAAKLDLLDCSSVWADVRDSKAVAEAMEGIDVVHHLAAETGVGQSQYEMSRYVSSNTYGTSVVLEAAVAAGVRQVVIASSRAVYGEGEHRCLGCERLFVPPGRRYIDKIGGQWDACCPTCHRPASPLPMSEEAPPAPTSVYGVTKLQQEQLAQSVSRTRGLSTTVLRFFNVYGPGQSLRNPYVGVLGTFFRRALSGSAVEVYEDGRMLRDFVFVDDVVEVLRRCTGEERAFNQTLNVGTGGAITLLQVANGIFQALGRESRISVSGRYRVGDIRHAVADTTRLEAILSFRAQTSFAQGLQAYVDWAWENRSEAGDETAERELAAHNLLRQGAT